MTDAPPPTPAAPAPGEPAPSAHHRRRPWRWVLGGVLVVLALIAGALVVATVVGDESQPKQPGSFYDPPAVLPSRPGVVIRSQPFGNLPSSLPQGTTAYLLLYTTSPGLDSYTANGAPPPGTPKLTVASEVVYVPPAGTVGPTPRHVVAWAHPTTGVDRRCAPSLLGGSGSSHVMGLATFLAAGDVVTATDYVGLGTPGPHPYLVGDSEAYAVLDGVRAAHAFGPAGASTTFAVWGHSQGGQAALYTGQDAAAYAPDLHVVGVAAAAPATDLTALLQADLGTLAGRVLGAFALTSWSQVFPTATLDQVVTPVAQPVVAGIATKCIESETQALSILAPASFLNVTFVKADPWTVEPWQGLLTRNTAGGVKTATPILVLQGTVDTIVRPDVTAAWVQAQCALGQSISEQTFPGVNHTEAGKVTAPTAAAWIAARFAGQPVPATCGG